MVSSIVLRRVLMTGAVVGVTVTGTLYGAGMKMEQEVKQVRDKIPLFTPTLPEPKIFKKNKLNLTNIAPPLSRKPKNAKPQP